MAPTNETNEASHTYQLFMLDNKDSFKGKKLSELNKIASEMLQTLAEEEQMDYKAKWSKLKADWQTDVAEWEERNAENPKMTELKVNKEMLETAKQKHSF